MGNFNIKSILLGIGIGMIISATACMIYVAGRDPMKDLSEQQIISQAEKYGMVKASVLQEGTVNDENVTADDETGIFSKEDSKASTESAIK